jgi:hypothetical protein
VNDNLKADYDFRVHKDDENETNPHQSKKAAEGSCVVKSGANMGKNKKLT